MARGLQLNKILYKIPNPKILWKDFKISEQKIRRYLELDAYHPEILASKDFIYQNL